PVGASQPDRAPPPIAARPFAVAQALIPGGSMNTAHKGLSVVSAPETKMADPVPKSILVVDIGGSKIKALVTGETEPRKAPSGKELTPVKMVEAVRELAKGWQYQAIS